MRKANARLAEAYEYAKEYELNNTKKKVFTALVALERACKNYAKCEQKETFYRFEIKKLSKGHFQVKADGKVIERNFKSITVAQEWCAKHSK